MAATDLAKTSTGVGHHNRGPGYYFPSSNFKAVLLDPLPAGLVKPDQYRAQQQFLTTTGQAHDHKYLSDPYKAKVNPTYFKAPGHWLVHNVKDLHEKLQAGGWRRPLTMGNQSSETHEEFRARPTPSEPNTFTPTPPGFTLHSHHTEGPAKRVNATTENKPVAGRTFYPSDGAVFDLNEPYMTTSGQTHRRFRPDELQGYAKKDVATYWETEGYPKAWGFGLHHNPLPADIVPYNPPPMIDAMFFTSGPTKVRRVPRSMVPVPHFGQQSVYTGHYTTPSDVKAARETFCPIDTPFVTPPAGVKPTFTVPQTYRTEYKNIGSEAPITV